MTETIEYEQFDQAAAPAGAGVGAGAAAADADLSRLSEIPMELSVEIGRAHMTVGETLELRPGAVVGLERQAGDPADLLVNGTAIARGEVIVVDEQYGLRITEILDGQDEGGPAPAHDGSAAAHGGAAAAHDGPASAHDGSAPAGAGAAEEPVADANATEG